MPSLPTILINRGCAIAEALRLQYQSRGRSFIDVEVGELDALTNAQLEQAVIIDLSWSVEAEGEKNLSEWLPIWQQFVGRCRGRGNKYLLLSEGRVVAGAQVEFGGIAEDSVTMPLDELGRQLAVAESFLSCVDGLQSLILRSGPVLSVAPDTLLSACLALLRREQPRVLENTFRACPTPAIDLARVLSAMTDQLCCGAECRGVFHYNSSGSCTHYEFVEVVHAYAAQFLPSQSVISESADGEPWQPQVPELSCSRLLGNFGIKQLPWRAWLPKLIKNLCEEEYK